MEINECNPGRLGFNYGSVVRTKMLVDDRVERYDIITTDELRNAHIIGWKFNGETQNHIIDFYNLEKFAVRYLYQNRMHEDYKYIGPIKKNNKDVGHTFFCNIDMNQAFTKLGDKIIIYFAVDLEAVEDISLIFRANEIPEGIPDLTYEVSLKNKIKEIFEEFKNTDGKRKPAVVNYGNVLCNIMKNEVIDGAYLFTGIYYIDTKKYADLIEEE